MKRLVEYLSIKNINIDNIKCPLQRIVRYKDLDNIINLLKNEGFSQIKHNDKYTTTSECFYEISNKNDVKVFTYHESLVGFKIKKYWIRFCNTGKINKSNPVFYINNYSIGDKIEYSYEYEDDGIIKNYKFKYKFKTDKEFIEKLKEVFK